METSFVTTGEIATTLGRSVYQVRYAVDSRRIRPLGRAGLVRVFDRSAVEAVRKALHEIDERRGTVPPV